MVARSALSRTTLKKISAAVVQVVALHPGRLGNLDAAWTGSGVIVHPQGYLLTNSHVADPGRLGLKELPEGALVVAVTAKLDEAPALTYQAEVVAQSPELDLAVLRIVRRLDGKKLSKALPCVALGDPDLLEEGQALTIFGYPGIGGDRLTLAQGKITGFGFEKDRSQERAWIKTDLTLAGGYSGGAAVNQKGELVGIPSHALAGKRLKAGEPQRILDTNRDQRLDAQDIPLLVGCFIKSLRPVNLAKTLLVQAGVALPGPAAAEKPPAAASPARPPAPATDAAAAKPKPSAPQLPQFSNLVFCEHVNEEGLPVQPAAVLKGGRKEVLASFEFTGMKKGLAWGQRWTVDGAVLHEQSEQWLAGSRGRKTLALKADRKLPDGKYRLQLSVAGKELASGEVIIGKPQSELDSEVSGQLLDKATLRGIPQAMALALKPEVTIQDFLAQPRKDKTAATARTDANGRFVFPVQLPKGFAYSLIVVARGYVDLAIEGALRLSADAPEKVQIYPLQLDPE